MKYDITSRKRTKSNYYYFTSHEHAINNIKNKRIKISSYQSLNDIHELLAINFTVLDHKVLDAIEYLKSNTGFISFSKYWDSPLMWGHYSDNNNGICLGFEIIDPMDDTKYSNKKIYPKNIKGYDASDDNGNNEDIIESALNTKSSDWVYEQESRLFQKLEIKDPETGLYFRYLDNNIILKEIILGPKSGYTQYDIEAYLQRINFEGYLSIRKTRPSREYFLIEKDILHPDIIYSYNAPISLSVNLG